MYISRIAKDGREQPTIQHLQGCANYAFNIGEKFETPGICQTAAMFHDIGKLSDEFDDWEMTNIGSVIGVGGSITNLASVKLGLEIFEPEKINGLLLTDIDIKNLLSLFISVSEKDRENIRGLQRGRASTIIAGSTIALAALRKLNKDCLTVSSKGLRHGLLISKRSS